MISSIILSTILKCFLSGYLFFRTYDMHIYHIIIKLQEKRINLFKSLALILPQNAVKVSKINV